MVFHTIQKLMETKCSSRSLIVGIDGLGGAGKTTLAQSIATTSLEMNINTIIIHLDDFIYPKDIRYDQTRADWYCYYYLQWRYDYLISEILSPLQNGDEIQKEIELYNKTTDTYVTQHFKISRNTLVIIEGVFLQRPELRPFFDFFIFIDIPKAERVERVIKRDTYIGNNRAIKEKYEQRYFPAEEKYLTECSPAIKANYIITKNSKP